MTGKELTPEQVALVRVFEENLASSLEALGVSIGIPLDYACIIVQHERPGEGENGLMLMASNIQPMLKMVFLLTVTAKSLVENADSVVNYLDTKEDLH